MANGEGGGRPQYASVREVAALVATVDGLKSDIATINVAVNNIARQLTDARTPQWQTIIMGLSFVTVTIGALWVAAINPIERVQLRHDGEIIRGVEEHRAFIKDYTQHEQDLQTSVNRRFRERDEEFFKLAREHEKEDETRRYQAAKDVTDLLHLRDRLFVHVDAFNEYARAAENYRLRADKTDDRIIDEMRRGFDQLSRRFDAEHRGVAPSVPDR